METESIDSSYEPYCSKDKLEECFKSMDKVFDFCFICEMYYKHIKYVTAYKQVHLHSTIWAADAWDSSKAKVEEAEGNTQRSKVLRRQKRVDFRTPVNGYCPRVLSVIVMSKTNLERKEIISLYSVVLYWEKPGRRLKLKHRPWRNVIGLLNYS